MLLQNITPKRANIYGLLFYLFLPQLHPIFAEIIFVYIVNSSWLIV